MILNSQQVAQYAYDAGFRGTALEEFIAIAYAESRNNTQAYNGTLGTYGLWQIEASVHGYSYDPSALYNPATNAKVAYSIYKTSGLQPWSGDGYQAFLAMGQKAAAAFNGYPALSITVNGTPTPAINVNGTTYLVWTVLNTFHIPSKYLGNGEFEVRQTNGQTKTIQGVVQDGSTYIPWTAIPGIKVSSINGHWNFSDTFSVMVLGAAFFLGLRAMMA